MILRDATEEDLTGIATIYNDAVQNSTAIWNEQVVSLENRIAWLAERRRLGYPVVVAVEDEGGIAGYSSFGDWRAFDGYRYTVEHSVYVRSDCHGQGLGSLLLGAIIERARDLGKHVMVGAIESNNIASIRLHLKHGFEETGRMPHVGTKFGQWLDLVWLQLILDSRETPDGSSV